MDREHPQPCAQQPLDQQPVRALDRDQLNPQAREHLAQRAQPGLVVRVRRGQKLLARPIRHPDVVLLRRPVDTSNIAHRENHPSI